MERRKTRAERRRNTGERRQDRIEKMLREHANAAYETELQRALGALAREFREWEQGRLSSLVLSDRIHRFREGAVRDLELRYRNNQLSMPVAHAIATGVLNPKAMPSELLEHLSGAIDFYTEEPVRMAS